MIDGGSTRGESVVRLLLLVGPAQAQIQQQLLLLVVSSLNLNDDVANKVILEEGLTEEGGLNAQANNCSNPDSVMGQNVTDGDQWSTKIGLILGSESNGKVTDDAGLFDAALGKEKGISDELIGRGLSDNINISVISDINIEKEVSVEDNNGEANQVTNDTANNCSPQKFKSFDSNIYNKEILIHSTPIYLSPIQVNSTHDNNATTTSDTVAAVVHTVVGDISDTSKDSFPLTMSLGKWWRSFTSQTK